MKTPEIVVGSDDYDCQLLYFTSPSLSNDDKLLFYICNKNSSPNIYVYDLTTGKNVQLTRNNNGYMKSYVYFDGDQGKGLAKAGIALNTANNEIFYIQDNLLMTVSLVKQPRVLAEIPDNQVTAYIHVNNDGTMLCVPTTDARALEYDCLLDGNPPYNIDARVQSEKLSSALRIYDTQKGELLMREEINKAWITHVQFSPIDSKIILFNHEWPSFDCGIRRMWIFDGKNHKPVRNILEKRNDWVCHEIWSHDGKYIVYHGIYENGIPFIGRFEMDTNEIIEIPLPDTYTNYGHFTISKHMDFVSDGYYNENGKAGYISVQHVDWNNAAIYWEPLCQHRSSWKNQDTHPHPIYSNNSDYIYFSSDMSGSIKIYRVPFL